MKFIRHLLAFLCCAALLCPSCAVPALASEETLSIVCTIFPAYDFARQLAGDTAPGAPAAAPRQRKPQL